MKVLVVHNRYQEPGGEDLVFADEVALLRTHGHAVETVVLDNNDVAGMPRLALAGKTVWNRAVYRSLSDTIRRFEPAVVHFHNTFPLVSPAGYYAARDNGARVVQTLHNYRLLCPAASFLRNNRPCEDCLSTRLPWPGVLHRCYRHNLGASVTTAAMLSLHRVKGTWSDAVDAYIALTEFSRQKFVRGGLPAAKVFVKPNFAWPDPGPGPGGGGYLVFAGRLSAEKGVSVLLDAFRGPLAGRARLKVVGDGPLRETVTAAIQPGRIDYLGRQPVARIYDLLACADGTVFPSVLYETFGRTIIESYAKGTPVVASRLGAMAELVKPGETGLLCEPGSPDDLARAVVELTENRARLSDMRRRARGEFLARYTAERNYELLMDIYGRALAAGGRLDERVIA